MRVSTLLVASISLSLPVTAQTSPWEMAKQLPWEKVTQIRHLINFGAQPEKVPFVPVPGVVQKVDITNWKDVLQDTDVDWLVIFTTGADSCPGCGMYEETFNASVALLQDQTTTHFARVDCDNQALLCSIFGSWGARVYHITHDIVESKSFPGMKVRKTILHPVPFHRPGTEAPPTIDEKGKEHKSPPPPPDSDWVAEVVTDAKWKDFKEWDDSSQPFEGLFKEALYVWWWVVNLFSGIPPMAMMITIGLLSRFVTSRFTGKVLAPKPRQPQAAGAAAAKKTK